ncbi:copper resistance D family protein [Serinicoccus chungangensis]|uniref:copper resistance D family protein n=1 Tax=Serinicoccus chungangensis TaxID=767452 RepID=UPI00111AC3BD|nr:CopD family protein [Serinicoccus chungangensis]
MALSPLERPSTDRRGAAVEERDLARPLPPPVPPAAPGRPRSRAAVATAVAVPVVVLVAALLVGGGAPTPPPGDLPDAGALTGWGLPVTDLVVRVLAVLTIGQLLFSAVLAPQAAGRPSPGSLRSLRGASWTAAGWLAAATVALVLTASTVYGVPVWRLSVQSVVAVLTALPVGRATLAVMALLLLVAVGAAALLRWRSPGIRPAAGVLLAAACGAVLVPVVLDGHSAAADNHVPAVLALAVHVLTASLWVGGLAALLLHGRGRVESVQAVRRFSALALGCVLLLLLSGVASALLVAGAPSWAWAGEGWVQLLAVKSLLLVVLALLGAQHRRATIPALAAGRPRAFVRLGAVEVALMTVTVAVSVALGSSPAPASSPTPEEGAQAAAPQDPGARDETSGAREGQDDPQGPAEDPATEDGPVEEPLVEDMSGHDHGDLSVTVLVDDERFHVTAGVRPGQRVTVYNSSDAAATITADGPDDGGAFDVDVPARTFVTFAAPDRAGDYAFVSRPDGAEAPGFADTLLVRAAP